MGDFDVDCLIVGCGLSGAVVARELAEKGKRITILERRNHVGGNMYDFVDEHGFLVQKYGPHTFHTKKRALYEYMSRYEKWMPFRLKCGAIWDGKYTPTPFNFTTIDLFYPPDEAERLKLKFLREFSNRTTVPVMEALEHEDADIRGYAQFLFQNDYAPYTAKQWGLEPNQIDASVLKRVPLRFSYDEGYFDDDYEAMPAHSYSKFFETLLNHPNIRVELGVDALNYLTISDDKLFLRDKIFPGPVVYTGALDELFGGVYGPLPYRSLRFEWKYTERESFQPAPVVAYPKEKGYTRITEYKKLPVQDKPGSSYAVEYPLPYREGEKMEPYYPVLTEESRLRYEKYRALADKIPNLTLCGRLADFKYYNMDEALGKALETAKAIEFTF